MSLGRWSLLLLLAANGWLQYALWFSDQGVVRWQYTEGQLMGVKKEIRIAEQRIARMKREIWLIQKEPLVVEEFARKELGMVYPDEILFVLPTAEGRASLQ